MWMINNSPVPSFQVAMSSPMPGPNRPKSALGFTKNLGPM